MPPRRSNKPPIPVRVYLEDRVSADLYLLPVRTPSCVKLSGDTTTLYLDSTCRLSLRLIERITAKYALEQNTPNPVTDRTTIRFSVGLDGQASISLYDAAGRPAATLVDGYLEAGEYQIELDATGLPAGSYICRMQQGSVLRQIRLVVVR